MHRLDVILHPQVQGLTKDTHSSLRPSNTADSISTGTAAINNPHINDCSNISTLYLYTAQLVREQSSGGVLWRSHVRCDIYCI